MPTSELVPLMRAQIAYSTILIASVLGSTLMATAQTGEFPLQVPGSVVHRGGRFKTNCSMPDPERPPDR